MSGLVIDVRGDFREWSENLSAIERKQLPFATALSLTWAAQRGQYAVQVEMLGTFQFKGPSKQKFALGSIRVQKATKQKPVARIYSSAPFLNKQEEGGRYRPAEWKKENFGTYRQASPSWNTPQPGLKIAIPFAGQGKSSPGSLKKKVFEIETPGGDLLLMQRLRKQRGKRQPGQRTAGVKAQYLLEKEVTVPKRWSLQTIGRRVAERELPRLFDLAMQEALRTAK